MPVFDERGKQINIDDDFPKLRDPEETSMMKNARMPMNKTSLIMYALAAVAVLLLIVTAMLAIKVNSINQELVNLSKTKDQLASAKSQIANITAEKERLKTQLEQAKEDLESMTASKNELQTELQKVREEAHAAAAAAEAAKKKAAAKPAPAPKKNITKK